MGKPVGFSPAEEFLAAAVIYQVSKIGMALQLNKRPNHAAMAENHQRMNAQQSGKTVDRGVVVDVRIGDLKTFHCALHVRPGHVRH